MQLEILYKKLLIYLCRKTTGLIDISISTCKTYRTINKERHKTLHLYLPISSASINVLKDI